jgi:hypothetical protein
MVNGRSNDVKRPFAAAPRPRRRRRPYKRSGYLLMVGKS